MRTAILASSVISPQSTHSNEAFPFEIRETVSNRLTCIEPDYRNIINPVQLRRMPRILKMGLAASQTCISRAGGMNPDAIIVGTGLGCLDNLEKFLMEVVRQDEHVTSVLPFINSTHNAVAAQVALLLKNHNYNITYCHRAFSFESALRDALMQMEEKPSSNILVGGIDECTGDFMKLHGYLGYWKEPQSNLQLLASKSDGTIAGEGAAFFMLGKRDTAPCVSITDMHTFLTPRQSHDEVRDELNEFLLRSGTDVQHLDGVMLGLNGDSRSDGIYHSLRQDFFSDQSDFLYFKHLCGEYYTASAFALWLGYAVLTAGLAPDLVRLSEKPGIPVKNLLIYNHFKNYEHSLILLKYD